MVKIIDLHRFFCAKIKKDFCRVNFDEVVLSKFVKNIFSDKKNEVNAPSTSLINSLTTKTNPQFVVSLQNQKQTRRRCLPK